MSLIVEKDHMDKDVLVRLFQIIKESTGGARGDLQEVYLKEGGTGPSAGQKAYTPPIGNAILNEKLDNLITYLNNDMLHIHDPLINILSDDE